MSNRISRRIPEVLEAVVPAVVAPGAAQALIPALELPETAARLQAQASAVVQFPAAAIQAEDPVRVVQAEARARIRDREVPVSRMQ